MRIQSLRTPATRIVTAPVLPITKNMEKFKASAQRAFEKKIQKLNWICETSIFGFSSTYQGKDRKTKLHKIKENTECLMCSRVDSLQLARNNTWY